MCVCNLTPSEFSISHTVAKKHQEGSKFNFHNIMPKERMTSGPKHTVPFFWPYKDIFTLFQSEVCPWGRKFSYLILMYADTPEDNYDLPDKKIDLISSELFMECFYYINC